MNTQADHTLTVPPYMHVQPSSGSAPENTNVVGIRKNTPKPRVFAQNHLNGSHTGSNTPSNDSNTDTQPQLNGSLTAAFYLVRDIINLPKVMDAAEERHQTEYADILIGALSIAKHIVPAQPVSAAQVIKAVANEYPQYSIRMLTDKCKPELIEAGVLIKVNSVKYRWADLDELQQQLGIKTAPQSKETPKAARTIAETIKAYYHTLQQLIDSYHRFRAKRNPWVELLPDGTIQKYRKTFANDGYTAEEKKAIREAYKRNSYAKLFNKHPALTPEAKQLAEQKQLEMIERKATQAAQMETLKMWAKIVCFLFAAWFVINTFGNSGQAIQPISPMTMDLPSGIYGGIE